MQSYFSDGTPVPSLASAADYGLLDPGNGLLGSSPVVNNPEDACFSKVHVIYCRYSSDMQRKESNANQERYCRDHARRLGLEHLAFVVISDEEVSGTKSDRPGWDRVLKLIKTGRLGVLVVFEQSRMDRGDNAVNIARDIRFQAGRYLSASECIDTDREGWEHLVRMASVQASGASAFTARRVHVGQEGRVRTPDGSAGDFPIGYRSEFEDSEEKRNASRQRNHRMKIVIDDPAADVVRLIFNLFVGGLRIAAIVRELVTLGDTIYRPTRGKRLWREHIVRRILGNPKYGGVWVWGRTKTIRNSQGKVKHVKSDADQVVWQPRPDLAIVTAEIFGKAQELLAEYKTTYGQKEGGKKRGPRVDFRILHAGSVTGGLIFCSNPQCGAKLQVSGSNGGVVRLGCPNHHDQGTCPRSVRVNAHLAETKVAEAVRDALLSIGKFLPTVMRHLAHAVKAAEAGIPKKRDQLQAAKADIDDEVTAMTTALAKGRGIDAIVNALRELEGKQKSLAQQLKDLAKEPTEDDLPTEADVLREFEAFLAVLPHGEPSLLVLLRQCIGRIIAHEVVALGKKRGYIILHLTLDLPGVVTGLLRRRLPPAIAMTMPAVPAEPVTLEIPLGEPTGPDRQAPQIYAWRKQTPPLSWSAISARTAPKLTIATCQIAYKRYAAAMEAADDNPTAAA